MIVNATLSQFGALIDAQLQRTLNLPPEQWFAIAAILTLWLYLRFVPDGDAAAA